MLKVALTGEELKKQRVGLLDQSLGESRRVFGERLVVDLESLSGYIWTDKWKEGERHELLRF